MKVRASVSHLVLSTDLACRVSSQRAEYVLIRWEWLRIHILSTNCRLPGKKNARRAAAALKPGTGETIGIRRRAPALNAA